MHARGILSRRDFRRAYMHVEHLRQVCYPELREEGYLHDRFYIYNGRRTTPSSYS